MSFQSQQGCAEIPLYYDRDGKPYSPQICWLKHLYQYKAKAEAIAYNAFRDNPAAYEAYLDKAATRFITIYGAAPQTPSASIHKVATPAGVH